MIIRNQAKKVRFSDNSEELINGKKNQIKTKTWDGINQNAYILFEILSNLIINLKAPKPTVFREWMINDLEDVLRRLKILKEKNSRKYIPLYNDIVYGIPLGAIHIDIIEILLSWIKTHFSFKSTPINNL